MSAVELSVHAWEPETDAGTAPTVFLVHGVMGWWKTWWRVGPALAEHGLRVVAVDLRAHGYSPAGNPGTLDDLADDLEAAIECHASLPVHAIVGHSLGAAVAQRLAWRRPRIARRLVLEDPPGVRRHDDSEFIDHLRQQVCAAREHPEDEVRREIAENPTWLEDDARQDVEGRALTQVEVIVDSIRIPRSFEVAEQAAEVRIPTRYLLASPDRSVMPWEPRQRLEMNLPGHSDIVVIAGGHTLHRDRYDEYLASVLAWID